MDGSYNKRAVRETSGPKKKPPTAVKDSAGSRDGTGQLCNRIGCCGRVNNDSKGNKHKSLEKSKPLKPLFRASSSKSFKGGSSKNISKISKNIENSEKKICSKTESSTVSSGIEVQEVNASGSRTNKLKPQDTDIRKGGNNLRGETSESNNEGRKRLIRGESSSSGKGKKIIVSDPKTSRNVNSCRTNGASSVRARKLNLGTSKGSVNQQSSSVVTITQQARESSPDGDHSTNDASTDRDTAGFVNDNQRGHYNIDGIADVLLALDRLQQDEELTFQQDEELTYEQLLSLEANLFLGGLNFFDQHRDMRLDIDNMSYEELLVLEEKMGTVSTALSEEELSKCIKTSIYESLKLENGKTRRSSCADDSKCSICQEEFVRGDEVGRLGCGHGYHTLCINQWLGLKNWCPICKVSPTPA